VSQRRRDPSRLEVIDDEKPVADARSASHLAAAAIGAAMSVAFLGREASTAFPPLLQVRWHGLRCTV
jgi:hypothetical protein